MDELFQARSGPARRSLLRGIKDHATLLLSLLACMWLSEIIDVVSPVDLDRYGIQPRSASGLPGILLAPLLHAGFGHLVVNSLPLLVLGAIVSLGGVRVFWIVTFFVTVAGGLGVWLLGGRLTVHVGASGLIFGYLGFVLARGWIERSLLWMALAGATLFLYGGMLFGVLPIHHGISWQSHLFGFFAGIAAARLVMSQRRTLIR